jgi:hypothetical protein
VGVNADVGGKDEDDCAQRAASEGSGQHRFAAGLVRGSPGQKQGGQDPGGIDGEDHRHDA